MNYSFSEEFYQKLVGVAELFVHLHVHSDYSNIRFKDSTNKIGTIINYAAKELHHHAVALTDHESLSGHVKFIKKIAELKKPDGEGNTKIVKDFKPILGNEIYLTSKELLQEQMNDDNKTAKFYHFILLAKDAIGHEQLRQLSSNSWENNYFKYKNIERVPTYYEDVERIIGNNKGHLVATTACIGSYLGQQVTELLFNKELTEDEKESIKDSICDYFDWCLDMFGEENFFIEIQPADKPIYEIDKETGEEVLKNQLHVENAEVYKYILHIAKCQEIPWIFTCDCHYLAKQDRMVHKAFLTSEDDEGNREVDDFYATAYFMDVFELADYLIRYIPENDIITGILNTKKIADMINEYDLYHKQIVPRVPLPCEVDWFYNKTVFNYAKRYEYIDQMLESKEDCDRYLAHLTLEGFYHKTLKDINDEKTIKEKLKYLERINIEFKEILGGSEIKGEPVSSYFICEVKNLDIIWNKANSLVGPGRGSNSAFLTDYYLGISQVSPLDHNEGIIMPHWRFITADRLKLDFPRQNWGWSVNLAKGCLVA